MNELKQLSVALAEHADRLERAPGVPYETCVRLTNIAERMEEIAHDAQVEIDGLRAQVEQLRESMEDLMAFQVKHLDVWHNLPYDRCSRLLKATNQTPEQSLVSVSDARQFDVRGYSWAIASNDGGVIASGSQPALAAKSETNTLGYLMDYSDRVGGDLYLAPTDLKNFDPIDTNNLIMGMTWDQLNAKQQGKALPSAIKSKMPSGAVKVYANGKLIGDSLSRQDASAERKSTTSAG